MVAAEVPLNGRMIHTGSRWFTNSSKTLITSPLLAIKITVITVLHKNSFGVNKCWTIFSVVFRRLAKQLLGKGQKTNCL